MRHSTTLISRRQEVSTLSGPVDDLADEVASSISAAVYPYIQDMGRKLVDQSYDQVVARFEQDKDRLADQVVEAAKPKVRALVAELVADPELAAKVGAAKEELRQGFIQSVILTSILSATGATLGVWLVMRKW